MIAKIIVWSPDRPSAIRLAKRVLASTTVLGLGTNQEFLGRCLSHPGFLDKNYTTGFIEMYREDLFPDRGIEGDLLVAMQSSLVFKYCAEKERERRGAFRSIGSKFRVQSMDKASVKTDHVTVNGRGYMVSYLPRRGETSDTVSVWQIEEHKDDDKTKAKFLNKNGGVLVHRYYSAMTPSSNCRTMEISIVHADLRKRGRSVMEEWIEGEMTFQIDRSVKKVFVATEGDWHAHDDSAQVLWIHSPEMCKGIKATRRSPLTFGGKLDERTTGSAAELGTSFLDFHVPYSICLVLQRLIVRGWRLLSGADAVSDITGYEEGWGEGNEGGGITCDGKHEDRGKIDREE